MQWLLKLSSEFFRFAAGNYEPFREKVEQLGKLNPRPFRSWFPNGDRIYIPFKKSEPELTEYDQEIISLLKRFGYEVDYIAGIAKKNRRELRIGKLLSILKEDAINKSKKPKKAQIYFSHLINQFNNSNARSASKQDDLTVVVSQDPHDIAQMSTGRGWKSCMTLDTKSQSRGGEKGVKSDQVFCEVQFGGLIAYLIRSDDVKIERPLARVLIRRFVGIDTDYQNEYNELNIAVPEDEVYGTDVPGFLETVKRFVDQKQGPINPGFYEMQGSDWSDTFNNFQYGKFKNLNELTDVDLYDEIRTILNNLNLASDQELEKISKIFYSKSYLKDSDEDMIEKFDFLFDFFVVSMIKDNKYFQYLDLNDSRTVNILTSGYNFFTVKSLYEKMFPENRKNIKDTLFYSKFVEIYKKNLENNLTEQDGGTLERYLEILPENKIIEFSKVYFEKLDTDYKKDKFIECFSHTCFMRKINGLPFLFFFKKYLLPVWQNIGNFGKTRSAVLPWLISFGAKASFLLPELKKFRDDNEDGSGRWKIFQFVIEAIEQNDPNKPGFYNIR